MASLNSLHRDSIWARHPGLQTLLRVQNYFAKKFSGPRAYALWGPCEGFAAPNASVRGFTLFELIVVMAFVVVVGSFSLLVSMESYRSYNFHTERDIAIAALQHARAQAIGNTCTGASCTTGKAHGVVIQNNKFIIFQGDTYAARDTSEDSSIVANTTVAHSGLTEVVFTQLSGNSPTPGVVTFSDGVHSSDITIGAQGQIFWTN